MDLSPQFSSVGGSGHNKSVLFKTKKKEFTSQISGSFAIPRGAYACVLAARNFAFVSFLLFRSAFAGQTNKQEKEGTCGEGLNLLFSCSRVFVRQPRRTFHEFRASLVSNFYVASMRVRQSWLTLE